MKGCWNAITSFGAAATMTRPSAVTEIDYWALCKAVLPFIVVETIVLLVIVFVPDVTLFLPRQFGF